MRLPASRAGRPRRRPPGRRVCGVFRLRRAGWRRRRPFPLPLPPLAGRADRFGPVLRSLIVTGAAGIITIGGGAVINAVVAAVAAVAVVVINFVVVAVLGIGIIIGIIIVNIVVNGAVDPKHITNHLNMLDHRQDVALRPGVAAGGAPELAAQDGLDGRHRHGMAVLHHDDRAVGLVQRQVFKASG
jgi:hypothetical protein